MDDRRRRVVWTSAAESALDEAVGYIAVDAPGAARDLLDRVAAAGASLSRMGERGRRVPEVGDPRVRELLVHPFRMIYRVEDGAGGDPGDFASGAGFPGGQQRERRWPAGRSGTGRRFSWWTLGWRRGSAFTQVVQYILQNGDGALVALGTSFRGHWEATLWPGSSVFCAASD